MIEKRLSMVKALGAGYNRFYHNRQFYRVVKGSRGSKKSKTAALCYIHDLLKYSWANLLVVRKLSNTSSVPFCEFCLEIVYVLHFFDFHSITVRAIKNEEFKGIQMNMEERVNVL